MIMNIVKIFVYLLLTLLPLHVFGSTPLAITSSYQKDKISESDGGNRPVNETAKESSAQRYSDHIEGLINSLQSQEDSKRENAEHELIRLALRSSENRHAVISALLKSVENIDELNGSHTVLAKSFPFWSSVTAILGKVKATEAINVLIRCVHCSNGYTGSLGEPPASMALIEIGAPAIPQLSEALLKDPNGYKRVKIALCLGRIGGSKARLALERALRSETEKDVRDRIEFVLTGMRSRHG
jgi:HEAT repeat protein